jgi:uncharacterized protein YjcR
VSSVIDRSASAGVMAERYNVSMATARKWKGREDVQD